MDRRLAMYTRPPSPWSTRPVDELICALDARPDALLEPQQLVNAVKQAFPSLRNHVITQDEVEQRLRILDARIEVDYFKKLAPTSTLAAPAPVLPEPLSMTKTEASRKSHEHGKEEEENITATSPDAPHLVSASTSVLGQENEKDRPGLSSIDSKLVKSTIRRVPLPSTSSESGATEKDVGGSDNLGLDELRREIEGIGDGLELSRAVKLGVAMQYSPRATLPAEHKVDNCDACTAHRSTNFAPLCSGKAAVANDTSLIPDPLVIRPSLDAKRHAADKGTPTAAAAAAAAARDITSWSTIPPASSSSSFSSALKQKKKQLKDVPKTRLFLE